MPRQDSGVNVRRSKFDPRIIVCEVVDDNCPQTMLEGLDKRGLGFAIWGESIETPVVVIGNRGDMSEDHLLAIEAHEVGHILTCSEDELLERLREWTDATGYFEGGAAVDDGDPGE